MPSGFYGDPRVKHEDDITSQIQGWQKSCYFCESRNLIVKMKKYIKTIYKFNIIFNETYSR